MRGIPIRMGPLALALAAVAGSAAAQEEPPTVISIALHPAAAPVPALKYRLLPERADLRPGNAAIFYHRAIEMMVEDRRAAGPARTDAKEHSDEAAVQEWVAGPLAAIPLERARGWLQRHRRALHEAELGARRRDCDWAFDDRPEVVELVIGEIQQMRSLIRLVALRARLAVREGKADEAAYWLRTGYAMARHVSRGPILIQTLIAANGCFSLIAPLEDLIQSPGMPSLYWALADRPRPLLDLADAMEGERCFLERELPRLRELDGPPWSAERMRGFVDELRTKLTRYSGDWAGPGSLVGDSEATRAWLDRVGFAALVAQAYPEAKRALAARGRSPAEVDAMPAAQAVLLETYRSYQAYRDDLYKWSGLPFPSAYEGMNRAGDRFAEIRGKPLLRLFCSILPAVHAGVMAPARVERRLDAIQCIEAIRLHAAAHGRLPSRLDEIAEAPVPIDVMTGRPFEYKLEDGRAVLSAPSAPPGFRHPEFSIHYELKPAR